MTFNINMVGALAQLSRRVYDEPRLSWADTDLGLVGFHTWKLLRWFDHKGTQAGLFQSEDGNWFALAVRGTELDGWDIMRDLQAYHRRTKDGAAHAGFLASWRAIEPEVGKAIREFCYDSPGRLLCTGHSLGGAVATQGIIHLPPELLGRTATFCEPRSVTAELLDNMGGQKLRVSRSGDPVVAVPPLSIGYRHVHDLHLWFDQQGRPVWNPRFWREAAAYFGRPSQLIKRHRIGGVISDLRRMIAIPRPIVTEVAA